MKLKKFAATAILAVAATGITAGVAQGAPAPVAQAQQTQVVSADGVNLGVTFGDDGTVTFSGAQFAVKDNTLEISKDGRQLAALPLTLDEGRQLAATLADNAVTLKAGTNVKAAATDVNGAQWFNYELQRAAPGAAVAAIIGGVIGLFFFGIGVIPGALLGTAAGLLISGGQPLLDAGFAYFQGR